MTPYRRRTFLDGCHHYGWIIAPILSAAMTLAMFAYFLGGINATVQSIDRRVTRMETTIDGWK